MPEYDYLSRNVKRMRKEMKESQIEFAANCGISTEALSQIERKITDPRLSTMQKQAAYTGVTVSELLSGGTNED